MCLPAIEPTFQNKNVWFFDIIRLIRNVAKAPVQLSELMQALDSFSSAPDATGVYTRVYVSVSTCASASVSVSAYLSVSMSMSKCKICARACICVQVCVHVFTKGLVNY